MNLNFSERPSISFSNCSSLSVSGVAFPFSLRLKGERPEKPLAVGPLGIRDEKCMHAGTLGKRGQGLAPLDIYTKEL